jgi:Carboxypeptidase regulatory-like domain/TonB dependent receptor
MVKHVCEFLGFILPGIIFATLSAGSLSAQTAGQISGHVGDTTGAVIPKVTVTLTNGATGAARSTFTTSAGDYTFPDVQPGTYSLKATAPDFKTDTAQVELQVQQSLRQDFTLEVGQITQTVTVESTAALLQADNPTLGTVVPTQTVSQMPLNSRNYLSLVAVSANTNTLSSSQGQAQSREGGQRSNEAISVGGQRIMYDHYTIDGINNTDVDFNSFVVQPTVDAIQEMKVQTGVYPAQYGYNATQVNVVTKSGGNQYHGTAFYFLRNNYADARGYNYTTTPFPPKLPFRYSDYGFVLSGPLSIPKVFDGKNRLFFMVNKEWFSQKQNLQNSATLPTSAVEGGDFSGFALKQGGPVIPIYDPATGNASGVGRTQFPGNVIPANRIDPTSALVIKQFYHPASASSFTNNYSYLDLNTDSHDQFTVRADYNQSPKLQWAFRFSDGLETVRQPGFPALGATVGTSIVTNFYQYMASNTWSISPTIVNVFTLGYTDFYNSLGTLSQNTTNAVGQINSGIPNLQPGASSTWGIPSFSFTPDPYTAVGDSTDGPYVTSDLDKSINDNITWVKGKHSLDFGFQYDGLTFSELGNQQSRGNFVFQRNATAQVSTPGNLAANTGSGFADFLLGDIYSSTYAVSIAHANYIANVEGFYFDDNYKILPNVTISAGLRYEITPPWYDTLGNEFVVDFQTNNTPITPNIGTAEPQNLWPLFTRQGNCTNAYQGVSVLWTQGSTNNPTNPNAPVVPGPQCANGHIPNKLMQTDYSDWAPRLGISYSPTSSIVVRAGYGIYYNHDIANARFDVARNLAGRITNTSGGGTPGVTNINWSSAVGPTSGPGIVAPIPPPYAYTMQYAHRTAYSQVFLFDVQKQVGKEWMFEAGYMGNVSRHLAGFRNANYSIPYGYIGNGASTSIQARTPYPNYGVIQMVHDIGVGNYNSFAFQVNRRFSNGFNLISSYTYSKSMDDTSGIRTQSSQLFPQDDRCISCEYGPSDFDVKHRVVGSVIYYLPIGEGRRWAPSSKIVDALVGGWEYAALVQLQTGIPWNPFVNANTANTNTISGGTQATRANLVSRQFYESHRTVGSTGQYANPAAFAVPAPGFYGNVSRNMLYGPGVQNYDMSLDKNFAMPYSEHHHLQIRFDAFNAFNHTNFANPARYIDQGGFGQITSTNSAVPARQLQLAGRYTF